MSNMEKQHDTVNSEGSAEHPPGSVQSAVEESEDDEFCLHLYEQYLADQDNGETVSFEDAAKQLGVVFESNTSVEINC